MPLLKKWTDKGGIYGIWHVTEDRDELLCALNSSERCITEMQKLKAEVRRMEYVSVRVLLKALTGKEFHILHYPSGKPYLEEGEYNISISHTKGYVAIAVHPTAEVGIDIEYFSQRVEKVASRFINKIEAGCVDKYTDQSYTNMLLLHWSAKETAFKLMNASEIDFLEHFTINPFHYSQKGSFTLAESRTLCNHHYDVHYMVHPAFVCTWCLG